MAIKYLAGSPDVVIWGVQSETELWFLLAQPPLFGDACEPLPLTLCPVAILSSASKS